MENKKPLILISNDDGYQAKGIRSLVEMVRHLGDIIVCAPEGARSGMACAFSATQPLTLVKRHEEPGLQIWSCNGTPVDCVKMALGELCDGRPPTTSDKELIAFNGFCICDDDYNTDVDFHFKVLRDGMWSEKPGREPVKFCELDEWGRYTGKTVYMYHKIDMKGADDE